MIFYCPNVERRGGFYLSVCTMDIVDLLMNVSGGISRGLSIPH